MALTVRNAVEALYRHLRKEWRSIPYDATLENPLPDALLALNGALQQMAASCPLFAAKRPKSAVFRPSVTLTTSAQAQYGYTLTVASGLATWMKGCQILLPGSAETNRIVDYTGTTVTLQFAYLGTESGGTATVTCDTATLDADVITVLEPVRTAAGKPLRASNGRLNLELPVMNRFDDYGRFRSYPSSEQGVSYFVESVVLAGDSQPRLRMMISPSFLEATNVEYQARCSLGYFDTASVHGAGPGYADPATPIPVPLGYVESVFLPLAVARFFATPIMRDVDPPSFVESNAEAAISIMEKLRPQGNKPATLSPLFG